MSIIFRNANRKDMLIKKETHFNRTFVPQKGRGNLLKNFGTICMLLVGSI